MSADHSTEFRERVLRRLAEHQDLDAVAQEFDLSPDLLFAWLKDAVDHGRRPGPRIAPTQPRKPARRPWRRYTPKPQADGSSDASRAMFRLTLILMGTAGVTSELSMSIGIATASHAWHATLVPASAAVGLSLFAWTIRDLKRETAADGTPLSIDQLLVMGVLAGILCALSVIIGTDTMAILPNRLLGQPFEARTMVAAKTVLHGRGTECDQITTTPFDPRFPGAEFCVDRRRYDEVRIGDAVVLGGLASWFGFVARSHEFVPVPKRAR